MQIEDGQNPSLGQQSGFCYRKISPLMYLSEERARHLAWIVNALSIWRRTSYTLPKTYGGVVEILQICLESLPTFHIIYYQVSIADITSWDLIGASSRCFVWRPQQHIPFDNSYWSTTPS